MEQRKTGEEWLKNLPLQKRLQFKENVVKLSRRTGMYAQMMSKQYNNLSIVLISGFPWSGSKQGHEYWSNINKKYGVDGN